jgi:hypothetical protein
MAHEVEIRQMTTDTLAQKCAQETTFYFNGQESDSPYCFALFRRAISAREEASWRVLMAQYEPLVARWVNKWANKHPDFPLVYVEKEDFILYASFSLALSPREMLAKYSAQFRDIKEIYQTKANVLEHLERDADVKEFARRQ